MEKDSDFNALVQTIKSQIQQTQVLMEAQLPFLEQEVNGFITNKSRSINDIERLLDTLLDYQQMGIGNHLFIRLLEYYKTVDTKGAADYWQFYEEMNE